MSGSGDRHLVIFTRRPRLGVGKRRLAADVGDLAAWRFQRTALAQLRRRLGRDPRWRTWLAITPDRPAGWTGVTSSVGQGRGDLGARLRRVLKALPRGRVVILGADTPEIRARDVWAAFRALGRSDAVFGPAIDGGYWLVGFSPATRADPPFDGVRWSTAHALEDTIGNLRPRPVALLRHLEDVDDGPSLARLVHRTSAWL